MATVKDIQDAIFVKLAENTSISLSSFPVIRIFLTREEHDAIASDVHLMSTYVFNRQICFALLENEGKVYFLTIGVERELTITGLVACDNQKILSMMSIAGTNIERLISTSESELVNKIFVDPSTKNVEWDDVITFFPMIMTYEVSTSGVTTPTEYQTTLRHLSLYVLTCSPEVLILSFEPATLQKYIDLLNIGDKNIPEDNLLHSLGSNYWRFCYVDIYRCVERLYRLGLVHNFKNNLSSNLAIDVLHTTLKDRFLMKTGIESHENTNLEYLISLLSPTTKAILDPVRKGMNHDNYIYHLRNLIVHYQKNEAELDAIDDTQWNIIIRFLLTVIAELYPMFTTYITALPNE